MKAINIIKKLKKVEHLALFAFLCGTSTAGSLGGAYTIGKGQKENLTAVILYALLALSTAIISGVIISNMIKDVKDE